MTSYKEMTRNQETGGLTRSYHQLTVFPGVDYLILLGFRHLETKLGMIIPPLAIAGSNESVWDIMPIVTTWEAPNDES